MKTYFFKSTGVVADKKVRVNQPLYGLSSGMDFIFPSMRATRNRKKAGIFFLRLEAAASPSRQICESPHLVFLDYIEQYRIRHHQVYLTSDCVKQKHIIVFRLS